MARDERGEMRTCGRNSPAGWRDPPDAWRYGKQCAASGPRGPRDESGDHLPSSGSNGGETRRKIKTARRSLRKHFSPAMLASEVPARRTEDFMAGKLPAFKKAPLINRNGAHKTRCGGLRSAKVHELTMACAKAADHWLSMGKAIRRSPFLDNRPLTLTKID